MLVRTIRLALGTLVAFCSGVTLASGIPLLLLGIVYIIPEELRLGVYFPLFLLTYLLYMLVFGGLGAIITGSWLSLLTVPVAATYGWLLILGSDPGAIFLMFLVFTNFLMGAALGVSMAKFSRWSPQLDAAADWIVAKCTPSRFREKPPADWSNVATLLPPGREGTSDHDLAAKLRKTDSQTAWLLWQMENAGIVYKDAQGTYHRSHGSRLRPAH
jgi:hypothetical protein